LLILVSFEALKAMELGPAELAARFVNYTSRHVFLTGKAGTGKTTFLRNLVAHTYKKAVIVAPTGIAAINASGVTIHSLFQLPFGTFLPRNPPDNLGESTSYHTPKTVVKHLTMNAAKRKVLVDMELLIVDEVSMLRADLLDAMDIVLRYVRKSNAPFGGVQVLFIGDLYQLPPVVKNNEWNLLSQFYQSIYFFDAEVLREDRPVYIELDKIYRQEDQVFVDLLNNLRNNRVTQADMDLLQRYYRADFKPELKDKYITLTTHNNKADTLNRQHLDELPGYSYLYRAKIEDDFSEYAFPADDILELKTGAQVMFIKNDPTGEQRFFNGKIAVVTDLKSDLIEVAPEGGGPRIVLEKYTWKNIRYTTDKVTGEIKEDLAGTFTQYPLKLAWAITVHKSQGLTFDKAIIDVGNAFAPGQVYVALSRLRSLNGLVLTSLLGSGIRPDQHVGFFSGTKPDVGVLQEQVKQETGRFLMDYLLKCFDLSALDNYVYEHIHSYNKDIYRSAKQKHHKWAEKLFQAVVELRKNGDKFKVQLTRLGTDVSEEGRMKLLERVSAASTYFVPLLTGLSVQVLERIGLVKQDEKQVKEFLSELMEMESVFYEQLKRMQKAPGLLQALMENRDFRRQDAERLICNAERDQLMRGLFAGEAIKKKKKTKAAAAGEPKADTKELSLELFRSGKTIAEIALERKMVIGTIEGHLAHYVAEGLVSGTEIIGEDKLKGILEAIRILKTKQMSPIREYLGREYSFGEIKIGVAAAIAGGD